MALTYRALLIPTAALDSSGSAKPNAMFSVTPMAGGSPVPVYGAAQGGVALTVDQIKTDALGNISGLYVAEPGPYTLSFTGGGTVVTSAVMDSRDVATSGDLADALGGTSPSYTYDGSTGLWTVTPGRTPGCAQFEVAGDSVSEQTTPGVQLDRIPLQEVLSNADVASLQADGYSIRFAAPGLYLIGVRGSASYWGASTAEGPEAYLAVRTVGPLGPDLSWSGVDPYAINDQSVEFSTAVPALCRDHVESDLSVSLYSQTHSWALGLHLTIVRLD